MQPDNISKKVMAFLEQEEKRLTGKAIKIPINVNLWKEKTEFTQNRIGEFYLTEALAFSKYENAEWQTLMVRRFLSKWKHSIENATGPLPNVLYEPKYDDQLQIEILKQFITNNYEFPEHYAHFRDHLLVYWAYQTYTYLTFRFVYPTVNDFISFTGIKLITSIYEINAQCQSKKRDRKRAKPGSDKMKSLADERKEKLKPLLKKYPNIYTDKKQKKAFVIEAMVKLDISNQRTIENYLKELKPKLE